MPEVYGRTTWAALLRPTELTEAKFTFQQGRVVCPIAN